MMAIGGVVIVQERSQEVGTGLGNGFYFWTPLYLLHLQAASF